MLRNQLSGLVVSDSKFVTVDDNEIVGDGQHAVDILVNNMVLTGIHETLINNDFNIYPNPSNGSFTIKSSKNNSVSNLEVINLLGETVYTENIHSENQTINLQYLQNGLYTLKFYENGKLISTNKIIIQK